MKIDHSGYKNVVQKSPVYTPGDIIRGLPTQELYIIACSVNHVPKEQLRLIRLRDGKDGGFLNENSSHTLFRNETDEWVMQREDS